MRRSIPLLAPFEWVPREKWYQADLDFRQKSRQTRRFTPFPKRRQGCLDPACRLAFPIVPGQSVEDSLGTSDLVVWLRRQPVRFKARIKTQLLPHFHDSIDFPLIQWGKSRQDPALAFRLGQADDDAIAQIRDGGTTLFQPNPMVGIAIIIADQENGINRVSIQHQLSKIIESTPGYLGIGMTRFPIKQASSLNSRFLGSVSNLPPQPERRLLISTLPLEKMLGLPFIDPIDSLTYDSLG